MQQPLFGAFFRDLWVSVLSDTCLLSRKRLRGPLFKAEIPEIGMAFRWVHLQPAGRHSWKQDSHGWAGAVTVHIDTSLWCAGWEGCWEGGRQSDLFVFSTSIKSCQSFTTPQPSSLFQSGPFLFPYVCSRPLHCTGLGNCYSHTWFSNQKWQHKVVWVQTPLCLQIEVQGCWLTFSDPDFHSQEIQI